MNRSRLLPLAGVVAALLCNFWVLEGALAKHTDPAEAWISDLAARTQAGGWRFQLLEVAAGAAIVAFALLLRREGDGRPPPLRRGYLALAATGALAALGGLAPLNCAEALERACELSYDPFDLLHTSANLLEVAALATAFALIGTGLARLADRGSPLVRIAPQRTAAMARVTLALGALWLALTALSGLGYLLGDLEAAKGVFQRGAQLVLGGWLALLGLWAGRAPGR